jgi:hypothetical protein
MSSSPTTLSFVVAIWHLFEIDYRSTKVDDLRVSRIDDRIAGFTIRLEQQNLGQWTSSRRIHCIATISTDTMRWKATLTYFEIIAHGFVSAFFSNGACTARRMNSLTEQPVRWRSAFSASIVDFSK